MTSAIAEPDTLADVVQILGDIPIRRILWNPRPGTATEADQLRYVESVPKRLVELIDGILVEKAMGYRESLFAASLSYFLVSFVRSRNLGVVGTPDAILRFQAGRNRMPDLHFTAWENLPSNDAHLKPVARYAPDLAVEILSENNTVQELDQKLLEYFDGGAKLVWIFDPEDRTVAVYNDPTTHVLLTATDTLDGGSVLPGFSLPLIELFNDPQLNPRQ